ncbi:hypothetical protein IW261DRAFT_1595032 [Armillaria novae-zelandiae]|uniref:DUF6534 domain-containing protein n=1 Tax=Armillaria novae-zelandiae TaxID=153914 RepID=A0AA39P322_9AGAR|nr:hypothetical protein IW261DRAFT_1595032 [Armillaria novae-zelandiae]
MLLAGMYQYLVSDFANPAAFAERGAGSGAAMARLITYASQTNFYHEETIVAACSVLLVQLFFCWRTWTFSVCSLNLWPRITFVAFTTLLTCLSNPASYVANSIFGFRPLLTSMGPGFFVTFALGTSIGVTFDLIMTLTMILSLHRARSGRKQSDHVITLLILFTVNTNLITTLISVGSLVTFLVFPNAAIYGGISLLLGKLYLNTFLAILNSRDYLREKLDSSMSIPEVQFSHPMFAEPAYTKPTDTITKKSFAPADDLPTEV